MAWNARRFTSALAAMAAAFAMDARAQGAVEVPSVPTMIGLGIASVPDYVGSDDRKFTPLPIFRDTFSDGHRYISLVGTQLTLNLLSSPRFHLGPMLNYHAARDDKVDDRVVKNMEKVDAEVELGLFGQMVFADEGNKRNRTIVTGNYLTADGRGIARLNVRWWHQVAPQWDLLLGADVAYGDKDYNNHYFGVNPGNVGTSGLPNYAAGSGVNQYSVTAVAAWYINRSWMGIGGVQLAQIAGDAKDSPLVSDRGDKNQATFLVGVIYQWR